MVPMSQRKLAFARAGLLAVLALTALALGVTAAASGNVRKVADGSINAVSSSSSSFSTRKRHLLDYTTLPPVGGTCTLECTVKEKGSCTPPSCADPVLKKAGYCDPDVCVPGSCPAYQCPTNDLTACVAGTCQTTGTDCTPKVCTPGACYPSVYDPAVCTPASCTPDKLESKCNVVPVTYTPDIVGTAPLDRCVIGCNAECTGTVTCTCPCSSYTIGFYSQSFKPWPPSCPIKRDTPFFTSGLTYNDVLTFPSKDIPAANKMIFQLAAQYIAAKLNQCNGACVSADILAALDESVKLITSMPKFQDVPNTPTCQNGIVGVTRSCPTLTDLLSAFNGATEC